eukprot:TRINITY_DN23716_c0_g1_i2.p1 TRINITY_DN23716_c0_g1~~TRINITY_DN23716_c0_g1_i2.p1  ORF type:complete len:219 (-),score=13.09 TRINITY_DN23716_c0_g1_i2:327-983(-)
MGLLIFAGAVLTKHALEDCDGWVDAVYFSVVTLSTIGYGDLVPHRSSPKLEVSLLALVGVPLFAMLLGRIVEIAYGKARNDHIHTIVGGLTSEKFDQVVLFCDEMWRNRCYNSKPQESRREEITPFEFLCFILTKNETISLDEVRSIMANFSELDTDGSGMLVRNDVEIWEGRGSVNPNSLQRQSKSQTNSRRSSTRASTRSEMLIPSDDSSRTLSSS